MYISCFLLLGGCSITKWQDSLIKKGNVNDAVNNAITDFIQSSKLIKNDSVFSVSIVDENDERIHIVIGVADIDIYPTSKNKVGTYDHFFPTRYVEKKGKLFYWNDTTQFITQEIISVLEKYNHIDYYFSEYPEILVSAHNDGFKGVNYYFCKTDLINYKKSGVSNLSKQYKTPILKCK